ncbi:PREDICTED: uncharacterized protein LOC18611557 [Theobroma cacao]|uniref:Uncharacterized protein LOC18611557 n=1 Tax=Theobroma cacao TaxID=3641 RepID=A0AB32W004_THECC|nr:PREDICTED: uncharacterized protein LOC18611557 [Theobroma cacao]
MFITLRGLAKNLQKWSLETFGDIYKKKKRLLAHLEGIQKKLDAEPNDYLQHLEITLIEEYNLALYQEELIWQQKVRLDWLKYGDSNSKFYHALVKSTQRKKKIIAFRRDDGSWCTDPKELEEMVVNFYQNLYKDDGVRVPLPMAYATVDQLKPMLEGLIGRSQSSFIPGRQAVDNVIVVQEVIYTMKTMKRRERALALKVDLEKAYDRVKWSFIREVMTEIGIPSNWISLIMNIVQSPTFAIIWNGNSSTSFSPSRDDLMLFGVATSQQVMLKTLDKFCQASGQKVNLEKSSMLVSANINFIKAKVLSQLAKVPLVKDFGKYLGTPMIHGKVSKATYQELCSRI